MSDGNCSRSGDGIERAAGRGMGGIVGRGRASFGWYGGGRDCLPSMRRRDAEGIARWVLMKKGGRNDEGEGVSITLTFLDFFGVAVP